MRYYSSGPISCATSLTKLLQRFWRQGKGRWWRKLWVLVGAILLPTDKARIVSLLPRKWSTLWEVERVVRDWWPSRLILRRSVADWARTLYIVDTLKDVGLPSAFTDVVHYCISMPSIKMLWRGEALESFNPSRVIRQGDPISPYLFVLCMERLSQMINVAVDSNLWKPIQLGRKGPKLSHLVFVDDLILYVEAFMNQVEIVNACLHFFCESLGEKASKEKTSFFF